MNREVVKKEPRLIGDIIINEWMPFLSRYKRKGGANNGR